MNHPEPANILSIAGRTLDPLIEQDQQRKNNEPVDSKLQSPWLVQFTNQLDSETIDGLQAQFGLKLADYISPRSYIESLKGSVALQLRADPRVRAVMSLTGDLRIAPALREKHASNEPQGPEPVDVLVFASLGDDAAVQIHDIVGTDSVIAVIDDRPRGGNLTLRVAADPETAMRLAQLDGVRWVQESEIVDDALAARPIVPGRVPVADALGLNGSGQIIGIIDNGPPDLNHCFFVDHDMAPPGPAHRKVVMLRTTNTPLGKHAFTSGIAAGDELDHPGANPLRGVAWGSRLACGNHADLETSTVLTEFAAAAAAGAIVHTNSWHSAPQGPGPPAT